MLTYAQLIAGLTAGTLDRAGMDQLRTELLRRIDTPGEGDDVAQLSQHAATLQGQIEAHNARVAAAESARAGLLGATVNAERAQNAGGNSGGSVTVLDRTDTSDAGEGRADDEREQRGPVQLGRAFTSSAPFKENAGKLKQRVVKELSAEIETRALFATSNFPSNFARVPGLIPATSKDQPLTVLDLVDRRPISTNTVEWVREDSVPSGAVEVTEGSAKPESTWSVSLQQDTAATIAHFINITRQSLDDEVMIQGYIEGRLTYGLLKRLNGQILNGNGTAPNLRGILNTVGIGTYTAGTATEAAIVSIRKAKTVAQLSEYDPDAVVVAPIDWEAIELSVDNNGAWRVSDNAQVGASAQVWGLRVVVTTAMTGTVFGTTGGTFLVGAFKEGATLWERQSVTIFITDSHASNFTSNILTLLAELRAALSVWRPKAFVKGTFGASRV